MRPGLGGPLAAAVEEAYGRGEEDEALEPLVRVDGQGRPVGLIKPGEPVVFANLRGERERQLVQALTEPDFPHFPRPAWFRPAVMATLVDYGPGLRATPIFESLKVARPLGRVVAEAGRRQLKVGETEKAIHLTYFFNGKTDQVFPGEERVFIKSEQGAGFAFNPRMKAAEVAQAALERLAGRAFDLVVVNLANVDVVNHVEDEAAVIAAVEEVDRQIGRLVEAAQAAGYWTVITADHGSAEKWRYEDGAPDTGHTDSPVPFIVIGPERVTLAQGHDQTQAAPTILHLLGLPQPEEMTGASLIQGRPRPGKVLLLIADGWGVREEAYGNLILAARTPHMDRLLAERPWVRLAAAGPAVGLPPGAVGNSEVGHLYLAAGRHVDSDRVRIDKALAAGSFYANPVLIDLARRARREGQALHVLGIASFYSSHGALDHLVGILETARLHGAPRVLVQAMLGRRGERAQAGPAYVGLIEAALAERGQGPVASVIGRHWSLDREEHWDRIEKTFNLYVLGQGRPVAGP